MKRISRKRYLFWIVLCEAVGLIAGLLTREGTRIYAESVTKPPLSPPAIVFPIAWTVLYGLMGIGAARVSAGTDTGERRRALLFFGLQLFFNFCWSFWFFDLEAFGFAFFWLATLLALAAAMAWSFRRVDALAGNLQWPYLLWLLFAGYLNLGVWLLNS